MQLTVLLFGAEDALVRVYDRTSALGRRLSPPALNPPTPHHSFRRKTAAVLERETQDARPEEYIGGGSVVGLKAHRAYRNTAYTQRLAHFGRGSGAVRRRQGDLWGCTFDQDQDGTVSLD